MDVIWFIFVDLINFKVVNISFDGKYFVLKYGYYKIVYFIDVMLEYIEEIF